MPVLPPEIAALPRPWEADPLEEIRDSLAARPRKLIALDDDPTGTQTVRDITVVTRWDVDTLRDAFAGPENGFFILTNSRALTEPESVALHKEVVANLRTAAGNAPFTLLSRSDSTLRGHYPAETDALEASEGPFALTVIAPFFEAGGRLTINDVHYVADGDALVPASVTPFAQDKVFGYKHSNLAEWVEEKTSSRITASSVVSISLETIRSEGPDGVERQLRAAPAGSVCIVNACVQRDMEVFAAAALRLEQSGSPIIYRSAAALVSARIGQPLSKPLTRGFGKTDSPSGGLIVVGSYVPKTTQQLEAIQSVASIECVELDVTRLLASDADSLVETLASRVDNAIRAGRDALLYTSRSLVSGSDDASNLSIGNRVSNALVQITRRIETPPRFLVSKGGITSSDIATRALEIAKATIIGQLIPGVPVWRSDHGARFPGLDLVVFPGNVGGPNALLEAYEKFARD